jgi:hypothetical protein
MTRARFFQNPLLGLVAAVALAGEARAAELTSPQQLMRMGSSLSLPFVPGKVQFRPTGRMFVTVSANDVTRDTTTVAAYLADGSDNTAGASKVFQTYVLHTVDAMTFSEDGNWLFLVGSSNGQGYATRLWLSDMLDTRDPVNPVATTIRLAHLPIEVSAAVDRSGTFYLGDATSSRLTQIPRSAFDNAAAVDKLEVTVSGSQSFAWGRGVHDLAISAVSAGPRSSVEQKLAFLSYESLPKISVVRLREDGANEVVDTLGGSEAKGSVSPERTPPLAMLITKGVVGENGSPIISILLGIASSLAAVDYDPLFQTLNVASGGSVKIRGDQGHTTQVDRATKLVRQTMLLGSDDRQATILVGDLSSTQLAQMTRQGVSLEQLGEIDLPGTPTSLSVSSDGGAAVIAIANSRDLQILKPSTTSSAPADDVRQLQRELSALGLNVGGIDGVIGKGTIAAVGVFNSATGSNVSVNDVSSALHAVSTFRQKCAISGFGCIVNAPTK